MSYSGPASSLIFFLQQHPEVKVDEEDLNVYGFYSAYICPGKGYLCIRINGKPERFHRVILGLPTEIVDHINRDKLDNRKCNLRLVTQLQNTWNRTAISACGSKGVSYRKDRDKYQVSIRINGKTLFLGNYKTEERAAEAYQLAAQQHFGEFAGG